MGINLLKLLTDQLGSDSALGMISSFLGEDKSNTSSALGSLLPSLLGGLISKSSSPSGASAIFDMITDNDFDGGMLDNLSDVFGGGAMSNAIADSGGGMLDTIFGNKLGGIIDLVTSKSGISRNSSSSLMKLGLPLVMSLIGKFTKEKSLDASGITSLLSSQKEHIGGEFLNMFSGGGFDQVSNAVNETKEYVTEKTSFESTSSETEVRETVSNTASRAEEEDEKKGGMGWLFPLIGLLLLGGLLWWFLTGKGGDTAKNVKDKVEQGTTATANGVKGAVNKTGNAVKNGVNATAGAVKDGANVAGNAAGKVVDGAKNAASATAGTVKDVAGKVVDGAKGAASATAGAVKDGANTVKDAAGNAAAGAVAAVSGTAANMSGFFKSGTAGSAMNLDQLKFDDNNEISGGNSAQIDMLVKELQANPDAKIRIEAFAKNKLFGKIRAEKVEAQLAKAGIPKNRVRAVGKAGGDQVLIYLRE